MSIVIYVGGRQESLKPTPGTTLAQVLQTICTKHKLDSSSYTLFYKNKELDLSLPFRLANLAPGAKLELKRKSSGGGSPEQVTIALQLPLGLSGGERLQAKFPLSATLWDLLTEFETSKGVSLTNRVDGNSKTYLQPVLTFLNTRVQTIRDLRTTTLQGLGITDACLLRLDFQTTSMTLEEARQQAEAPQASQPSSPPATHTTPSPTPAISTPPIPQPTAPIAPPPPSVTDSVEPPRGPPVPLISETKPEPPRTPEIEMADTTQPSVDITPPPSQPMPSVEPTPMETTHPIAQAVAPAVAAEAPITSTATPMELSTEPAQPAAAAVPPETAPSGQLAVDSVEKGKLRVPKNIAPNRDRVVFPPSDRQFDPSEFEVPDDFFELTPEDAANLANEARERKRREEREREVLKTRAMREHERLQRLRRYTKTLIRVRFPDRTELQGTFHPAEPFGALIAFVTDCLQHPEVPFYLYTTPPVRKLEDPTAKLRDLELLPAAIVHFAWRNKYNAPRRFLKDELVHDFRERLHPVSYPVAQPPPTDATETAAAAEPSRPARQTDCSGDEPMEERDEAAAASASASAQRATSKVPKWFLKGKK